MLSTRVRVDIGGRRHGYQVVRKDGVQIQAEVREHGRHVVDELLLHVRVVQRVAQGHPGREGLEEEEGAEGGSA